MKIYFAGPLFTTAERDFNAALVKHLRAYGHELWVPQEQEQKAPVTAQAIFSKDVDGIMWADAILGCMDGSDPDSGTCWECGRAHGTPVVLYRTDIRQIDDGFPPFNLMLTQSATRVLDCRWKTVEQIAAEIQETLTMLE